MTFSSDIVTLLKPRITLNVVLTAAGGLFLAPVSVEPLKKWLLLIGMVLIVGGANALNMYIEREIDGRATRTRNRPLPAGRMQPRVALTLGLLMGLAALPVLTLGVNLLTGILGVVSLVLYVMVYTPMKQHSPGALVVGAIPGAMPPLMGWTAATGHLELHGLVLFAIMFLWQLPHFLAITLYRTSDYRNAGYKVTVTEHGLLTAKVQIVLYLAALVPVSLMLVPLGIGGPVYLWTALLGGAVFFGVGVAGMRKAAGNRWARLLFTVSLLYMSLLMVGLLVGQALNGPEDAAALLGVLRLI